MAITLLDVRKEYTRDKNLKEEDVKTLLNWSKNRPHLPEINEIQAILFLQRWNYRIEEAQRGIDSFFTFKTFSVFLDRNPSNQVLNKCLDTLLFTVLPKKTPEGHFIIFGKVLSADVTKWGLIPMLKFFDMVISLHLHENGASQSYIAVFDMDDFPLSFVPQLGLPAVDQFFEWVQEQKPWKFKELHYFNTVPFMDEILSLIEPVMRDLAKSLYLHKRVDDLVKYVPRENLPKDYGGSADSLAILHEKIKSRIFKNASFFKWEDKQIVDESRRFLDVEIEYAKDENLKTEDVKAVLNWAKNQPHLPQINEVQAILFLQKCGYETKEAQKALDTYFTHLTSNPDLFLGRNPSNSSLREALDVALYTVLSKKTPEGYSIVYAKILGTDSSKWNLPFHIKYFDMVTTLHLHQEETTKGYMMLWDISLLPYEVLAQFHPSIIMNLFKNLQELKPWNLTGIHIINGHPFMDQFLNLTTTHMSKWLRDNLLLHDSLDDLQKYIPRECLPKDLGGDLEPVTVLHEKIKKKLLNSAPFFEWQDGQVVDEKRREENSVFVKNGN